MKNFTATVYRFADGVLANNDNDIIPKNVNEVLEDGSGSFGIISSVFAFIGVGILIFTAWRVVLKMMANKDGKIVPALQTGVVGIFAAVLCFNLTLPMAFVSGFGNILSKIVTEFNKVIGG